MLIPITITNIALAIVVFAVIGFFYSFISLLVYSRMMPKARIMGCSNLALYGRVTGCHMSMVMMDLICTAGAVMFIPAFVVICVFFASTAAFAPANEEQTRELVVDYIQNNNLY